MAKLAIITDATTAGVINFLPIPDAFTTALRTRLGNVPAAEAAAAFLDIAFMLARGHFKSQFEQQDTLAAHAAAKAEFDALLPE